MAEPAAVDPQPRAFGAPRNRAWIWVVGPIAVAAWLTGTLLLVVWSYVLWSWPPGAVAIAVSLLAATIALALESRRRPRRRAVWRIAAALTGWALTIVLAMGLLLLVVLLSGTPVPTY